MPGGLFVRNTEAEVSWLAGLLEGEGYFGVFEKRSTTGLMYPALRLQLNMTDEDIVRRAYAIAGVGGVRGPLIPNQKNRKPVWSWTVHRRDDVAQVLGLIRPWMGQRRGARIDEALAAYERSGRPSWQHGTRQGYEKHRCRCDDCRAANTARMQTYRKRNP